MNTIELKKSFHNLIDSRAQRLQFILPFKYLPVLSQSHLLRADTPNFPPPVKNNVRLPNR